MRLPILVHFSLLGFAVTHSPHVSRADDVSQSAPPSNAAPAASMPSGSPRSAQQLFQALATVVGLEARFTEAKHLALLKAPLRSSGRLYYKRPGYLVRQTESPSPNSVRITPTSLTMTDASGTQTIDLKSRPDVKLFVESFTRVLAGDERVLRQAYEIEFRPAPSPEAPWTLQLRPKQAPLSQLIRALELTGTRYRVEQIVVTETQGDRTVTTLHHVDAGRQFTADEAKRLFGIAPPTP